MSLIKRLPPLDTTATYCYRDKERHEEEEDHEGVDHLALAAAHPVGDHHRHPVIS